MVTNHVNVTGVMIVVNIITLHQRKRVDLLKNVIVINVQNRIVVANVIVENLANVSSVMIVNVIVGAIVSVYVIVVSVPQRPVVANVT
uniref:Transmembrane protein n=1 Tax=Pithovirus LCPAC201 TaxID=2506591 RepID=A0A481Z5V9_9VIRU|nr:MAG: hypothetical protein LCPAC201_02870 [Pithovirus LCPAC201]